MHLATVLISTALAMTTGANAWNKTEAGKWHANERPHYIGGTMVYEACTVKDTQTILEDGKHCSYFKDNKGTIILGKCQTKVQKSAADSGKTYKMVYCV